ncbi:MAG: isochorismatase family protein [Chloroflexi bacterium]|nr:isochorismatase family protein [Chloroflexota bacterium]
MTRWQDIMPEEDRAIYEKAGYCERQPFGRNPALLVIDVTTGFIGKRPENVFKSVEEFRTSCGDVGWDALPNIKKILDACRDKGLRVVYTRGSPTNARFVGNVTKRDLGADDQSRTVEAEQIPELIAPRSDEWILEKPRASAFFATPLATYLHMQGVDSVLVTGCVTSGCVRATVVDACSHGFRVFMIEEGVFDRARLSHLVSLYELNAKYANVITVDEAVEYVRSLQQ